MALLNRIGSESEISKRTERRRSFHRFYDHLNERYSCTDAVQIGGSIVYPTAHTAAVVLRPLSPVPAPHLGATVLHGESTLVPVWNWKLLGVVEHAWTFLNESRQLDSEARRIPHVVDHVLLVGGRSASKQTSLNVNRKRIWGSSVLASLDSGALWVCGAGWFSRGFPVCGLPFLCPLVFPFCVFHGDLHSRSIDLAVTELQEPAPYRYPLQR